MNTKVQTLWENAVHLFVYMLVSPRLKLLKACSCQNPLIANVATCTESFDHHE